jgi:hypothetical protein
MTMRKLAALTLGGTLLLSSSVFAQAGGDEIAELRAQIELLTKRLDQLEQQNQALEQAQATAPVQQELIDSRVDQAVSDQMDERLAGLAWAERMRWSGDFRYRFEGTEVDGSDNRNRSRIRARALLEADLSPTLQVGVGLATGGDDPVSSNQTIGGGGSSKDIKLDLAYFNWEGLKDTRITGGKFKNYLARPNKRGLLWDGDWRPEGLGLVWDNDTFFAHGLGTWLEGDSRNGTVFAWVAEAGMNFDTSDNSSLMLGAGYAKFDIAGRTPIFGDPDDFYGNSFVLNPVTGELAFKYDYRLVHAFAEWNFRLGKEPVSLFGDYVINTDADENDTGYLFGVKYGSAKARGTWDVAWFYERLEADAVVGLLTDSDFGGGGSDARGHVLQGTYAFHPKWNFKATYFMNEIDLASGDPRDLDRVQLDLNFKFD